ncbi:hypothetical protein JCM3770_007475 [Rhodotorula araucariae]
MLPDAADGRNEGLQMADLFTGEDIVDRIVDSINDNDVYLTIMYIRDLEKRDFQGMINSGHSGTGVTPLVAAGAKEQSRTASLLVHLLKAKGAELPSVKDSSEWLGQVNSWALAIIEGEPNDDSKDAVEVKALLEMDFEAAERWCHENLPPPAVQPDLAEQYGGYMIDGDGDDDIRAASVPVDVSGAPGRAMSPLFRRRETTLDNGVHSSTSSSMHFLGNLRREVSEPVKPVTSLGYLDLTDDRSPSPVPKEEEVDGTLGGAPPASPRPSARAQGKKRAASRSRSRSPGRDQRPRPVPRAHLRVDDLPDGYTSEQLLECFDDVPGVLDAEVHISKSGALWGFVSLASLATAQHAFAYKNGSYPRGMTVADPSARPLALKIYSVDGTPVEPQRQVEPVANNPDGVQFPSGGGGARGARMNGGPVAGGNNPYPQRYFGQPRPRVPYIFTAAELARRVYCGNLRFNITYDEVASLFSEKAGVVAKVQKVMNAIDNSHSFAFVQLPDAITADHAIQVLHGTKHEGHLVQIEHVNELGHKWLFSLSLYGLPSQWRYHHVSDFLISTIGTFSGLIVTPPRGADQALGVRVELRYETELKWAFNELNGHIVASRPIRAEIDQERIRKRVDRDLAYRRVAEQSAAQAFANAAEAAGTYDPRFPAQAYPPSPSGAPAAPAPRRGSVTPSGGRRAPPPPPPPPPPPATANGAGGAQDDVEAYNPFALSFLK